MARFVKSNDESSTRQTFKNKINYAVALNKVKAPNLINFNFGEKIFYGRMNRYHAPMILDKNENSLASLTYVDDTDGTLQAVNFVAEAFNEMALQFKKSSTAGKIHPGTSYLSNIAAYKAFEDPFTKYMEYKKSYFAKLLLKFKRKKINFLDMDEFLSALIRDTQHALPLAPLTYPGFIKSKFNNILSTGLAIEIADLSYTNDQQKIISFVQSPNWNYFVQTCSAYGFMVDKNIPWRIVADVSPGAMKNRTSTYPIGGPEWLFGITYTPAALSYLDFFVDDLLELYNLLRDRRIQVPSFCNGRTITRVLTPKTYTPRQAQQYFTLEKIMIVYCTLRLNETKPNLSDNAKKMIINDCLNMYQGSTTFGRVLRIFENSIAKTFDSMGSYSYIKKTMQAKLEAVESRNPYNITVSRGGGSVISSY